jgi:hypothetical protein
VQAVLAEPAADQQLDRTVQILSLVQSHPPAAVVVQVHL